MAKRVSKALSCNPAMWLFTGVSFAFVGAVIVGLI